MGVNNAFLSFSLTTLLACIITTIHPAWCWEGCEMGRSFNDSTDYALHLTIDDHTEYTPNRTKISGEENYYGY
jgi:hypothetical protein